MSKVGRKPINTQGVTIEVKGQEIHYKGQKATGVYILPVELGVEVKEGSLLVVAHKPQRASNKVLNNINRLWGLHHALLANNIKGAQSGFEKQVQITGLGYKAVPTGSKLVFHLGFAHKIDFEIPNGITIDVDSKTGQLLTIKGSDKVAVGAAASKIRSFKKTEPYKGTGIRFADEVIIRKAGKTSK